MTGSEPSSNGHAADHAGPEAELDLVVEALLADEKPDEAAAEAFLKRASAFLKRRQDAALLLDRLRERLSPPSPAKAEDEDG